MLTDDGWTTDGLYAYTISSSMSIMGSGELKPVII